MKVKELIEELQKVDPELSVRVYADHGQCDIPASTVGVRYSYKDYKDVWMLEESYSEKDFEEEPDIDPTIDECFAFVEIGAH